MSARPALWSTYGWERIAVACLLIVPWYRRMCRLKLGSQAGGDVPGIGGAVVVMVIRCRRHGRIQGFRSAAAGGSLVVSNRLSPRLSPGISQNTGRGRRRERLRQHYRTICSAARIASAIAVKVGFTPEPVTNTLVSQMYRFGTSCVRQKESTTEVAGSSPIRHVPIACAP